MSENSVRDRVSKIKWHYTLFTLPFVWQLAMAPVVNGVIIRQLPIPFPMLWQMIGVVLSSAVIAVVYRIDRLNDAAAALNASERSQP